MSTTLIFKCAIHRRIITTLTVEVGEVVRAEAAVVDANTLTRTETEIVINVALLRPAAAVPVSINDRMMIVVADVVDRDRENEAMAEGAVIERSATMIAMRIQAAAETNTQNAIETIGTPEREALNDIRTNIVTENTGKLTGES